MQKNLRAALALLVSAAPLFYLAAVFQGLPATVPIHFDASGNPNNYAAKAMLWVLVGGMALLSIGLFFLMDNLHKIDPKRAGKEQSASISRLAEGLPLFISAISFMIVHSALVGRITYVSLVFAVVGFLFVFMGNMMFSLKPNSFAGIKVPWTIADDTNWKVTHRVAGRVWVAAGLLVMIGAFTLPGTIVSRLLLLLVVPMVGIPAGYSFWYFKHSGSRSL